MAFQTLTIDLNANLQKLAGDLDQAQKLSDDAYGRITKSAAAAGTAIGDAANQADFGDLSKSASDAASSMDQLKTSAVGTGSAVDQAKAKLSSLFQQIDQQAGAAYDSLAAKSKVVGVAIGVGISALLAGTLAGTVYAAYKLIDGLASAFDGFVISGDAYKSKNIDSLDEQDKHVRQLQQDLALTATSASALDLALQNIGTSKSDFTGVYTAAESAIRKAIQAQDDLNRKVADARQTNDVDAIDAAGKAVDDYTNAFKRLGVQYQDERGNALATQTVVQNASKVLDEYTAGFDRNAAAAELGLGSAEKVAAAAKLNADNFAIAAQRQKDYYLVIGPGAQQALDEYHQAVNGFKTESDLMSQGFKAAIADSILPLLTDLANYFKDGFPAAVGVFREVLTAAVATLEFFKTGVFVITEPVIAAFESIGIGAAAGMLAVQKALHFDFSGALHELDEGRKAIIDRFASLPDEVAQRIATAEKNINLARGADSDGTPKLLEKQPGGRAYTPAPDKPAPQKTAAAAPNVDVAKKQLELQLKDLDLFIADEKQQLTERDQFLELYYQHGDISIADYYAQRKSVQDDYVASAKQGYEKEIADLQAYIAKTQGNGALSDDQKTARVTDAQTKLIEVRNKLRKVEADANQETLKDWFANRDAVERYGDQLDSLVAQIHTFSGDSAKAFEITFDAQNRQLKRQLAAVRESDTSSQPDRNRAAQALVDLDQIKKQGIATAQLNDLTTERSAIMGDLANQQDRITLAVSRGSKTELQGLADSDAANKSRIAVLEQISVAYDAIAETSNNLQDKVNADALHVQLDKLKTQTTQLADAFNDAGKDITENFIDKLTDKTATLHDKIKSLLDDISKRVLKQGEDLIGNYLFGKDGGLLSGVGTQLASLFKPAAGAAASSISGTLGQVAANPASDAANASLFDFSKILDDTNSKLGEVSDQGFGGLIKSSYDYIAKLLTGTTTQVAATTATTSATTALTALTTAATSAATALASVTASGGGGSVAGVGGLLGASGGDTGDALLESGLLASAKGNIFSGGNVIPFARGGIVDRATVMPMALMGEAGPEAIVPLRRARNGSLGVAMQNAPAQAVQKQEIHLHYYPAAGESRATTAQRGATLFRQGQLAAARNA